MKVFVFCFAIFLATAVQASPVELDDSVIASKEVVKSENVIDEAVAEPVELIKDELQSSEKMIEAAAENEKPVALSNEKPAVELSEDTDGAEEETVFHLIDEKEKSEQVAVPYEVESEAEENVEGEAFLSDDEEAEAYMTEEEKERNVGIDIPMCSQYTNDRVALHLSHLTDCGKFYKCYNGKAYLMDCPGAQHWSVRLDRCDYAGIAKCVIDGTHQFKIKKAKAVKASAPEKEEDEDKPEVGEFEIDPRCEGSDPYKPLHFKHPNDCSKFYKCYMGKAYVIKCPKGQQWAQALNRCEHAQIARCTVAAVVKPSRPGARPAQAVEDSGDSESSEEEEHVHTIMDDDDYMIHDSRCAPDEDDIYHPIQFAHPTDCTMFYKCWMHQAFKSQCPFPLHYNQKAGYCDYPYKANCRASIQPAQAIEELEESNENQEAEEEHMHAYAVDADADFMIFDSRCAPDADDIYHPIQFAHPTDCTMFYMCSDHRAFKSRCPPYLHYNEKKQYCDYADRANCKASVGIMEASSKVPLIPKCPQKGTANFAVEGSYANYFACENGVVFYKACEKEELFNPYTKKCEKVPEYFDINQILNLNEMPMNEMPGMINQYQGNSQQFPMIPMNPSMPHVQRPQTPNFEIPQIPNQRPQQVPQMPEFPNWMPVPNQNLPQSLPKPELPTLSEKPSHEKPSSGLSFNYQNGKENSRCPSQEEPTRPTHLSHETDCQKFYKCFNGRAFLMECPVSQEWSDELQRCDYHQFANCDPVELLKKKIRN